jgi:hypothetical protein
LAWQSSPWTEQPSGFWQISKPDVEAFWPHDPEQHAVLHE